MFKLDLIGRASLILTVRLSISSLFLLFQLTESLLDQRLNQFGSVSWLSEIGINGDGRRVRNQACPSS